MTIVVGMGSGHRLQILAGDRKAGLEGNGPFKVPVGQVKLLQLQVSYAQAVVSLGPRPCPEGGDL